MQLLIAIVTQALTFLPLALGLYVSSCILRATDMTLDGSFVLGAAIFARLVEANISPLFAGLTALVGGALAGIGVSIMQRGQKISSLLAGVLATFILASGNLVIMGRPNISLLGKFNGWMLTALCSGAFCLLTCALLASRYGLLLRAFGDNPDLLARRGKNIEMYRMFGFAFTNMLAAASGCITAQTIGYADIGMGFGMTLTALGAIILGKQFFSMLSSKEKFRVHFEFGACLVGVLFYFFAINGLLRLNIDPVYLKMLLGVILVVLLRGAVYA